MESARGSENPLHSRFVRVLRVTISVFSAILSHRVLRSGEHLVTIISLTDAPRSSENKTKARSPSTVHTPDTTPDDRISESFSVSLRPPTGKSDRRLERRIGDLKRPIR